MKTRTLAKSARLGHPHVVVSQAAHYCGQSVGLPAGYFHSRKDSQQPKSKKWLIYKTDKVRDMDQLVKAFFLKFEKANSSSDVSTIGSLYAERFMFAGPNGVQAINNEDFVKVIPKLKAHFSSMGVSETQLQNVEAKPLDSKYLLATVLWRMKLGHSSGNNYVNASATYVLVRGEGDALSIVLQIDHQDLASAINRQQNAQQ